MLVQFIDSQRQIHTQRCLLLITHNDILWTNSQRRQGDWQISDVGYSRLAYVEGSRVKYEDSMLLARDHVLLCVVYGDTTEIVGAAYKINDAHVEIGGHYIKLEQ